MVILDGTLKHAKKKDAPGPALRLRGAGGTAELIACAYTADVVRGGMVATESRGMSHM